MMSLGGKLVIVDCDRRSLLSDRGFTNPFNPRIQWFKHQGPELWAGLLRKAGFGHPQVRYLGNRMFRYAGIRHVPAFVSYCMDSAFRLEVTAMEIGELRQRQPLEAC